MKSPFEPGLPVIRLVGLPGYEKGFPYVVSLVSEHWNRVDLSGCPIRYSLDGRSLEWNDASRIVPANECPWYVKIIHEVMS